jgi:hypothetical protein
VGALEGQGEVEQLRKATIVVIALRTIAIPLNPFRMLIEKCVVHCALKFGMRRNISETIGGKSRSHIQLHTFSRSGTGLKIRSQLLPELKIDMLNASIGSCRRRRAPNHFRDFFWFVIVCRFMA